MLQNLLDSALPDATIVDASLYALIGFLIVFAGIAFLILIVWIVGKIITKTAQTTKQAPEKTPAKPEEPIAANTTESDEISEETIAVIMAALTSYYQTNNPKCEFTLKRIKRM